MRLTLAAVATLLVAWSPPAAAQQTAPTRPVADTTAVRIVAPGVVRELDDAIADALFAPAPRPWTIAVPDSASPAWRTLGAGLRTLLRARPTGRGDDRENFVRIETPKMRGDTLVTYFVVGGRRRCDGEWRGSYTGYEVFAVRYGDSWEAPRTRTVLHGDSAPCVLPPRRPPPGATVEDRIRSAPPG